MHSDTVTEMEGLIYKVQPYREHARMCFLYTPKGKVTLIAQGAQKMNHPYRVLAQYMTKVSFKDTDKPISTLSEGRGLDDYQRIKDDFQIMRHAAAILEIIDRMVTPDLDHEAVYRHASMALDAPLVKEAALSFAFKMLSPLGVGLSLEADGRSVKGVSAALGSIVYAGISDPIDLDVKEAIVLLKLMRLPYDALEALDPGIFSKMLGFLRRYVQIHLNTTIKTLE
jgi:DNA repair protein RecO (recombination protein O)